MFIVTGNDKYSNIMSGSFVITTTTKKDINSKLTRFNFNFQFPVLKQI